MNRVDCKRKEVDEIKERLKDVSIDPVEAEDYLRTIGSSSMQQKQKAIQLLMRPGVELNGLSNNIPLIKTILEEYDKESIEQAEIQLKYDVYIEKEKEIARRMGQLEELEIPENFNYERINALSAEALQKFRRIKPRTLGQASRISGVNPSDVQILMVYMGR
jgi:tRNA uridine 5-carboxymethylaminomethyl modification enzyme